ncbi:uncharacterized protein EV154DRAFT_564256 [Mucor mucedo]|uniref:uncharacterized protein n=1 Tax=Mucor mucedo TaxID=29922 RepID=UPI002220A092|nr:uncharacterized protein EV154DRAFT_564256 [Mucor mucedo]KAI7890495.1 hypothetical protein EV154DRAFT_564256 [Mucor mucedo]
MSDNNTEKNSRSSSRSYDYADDSWVPKIKRRRRFTADETKILEGEYDKNPSPNQDKIQTIADIIKTPRKIVTTWFQNRRAKNKRKEKTRKEENAKGKLRVKCAIKDDDNYIDEENETSSENYDDDLQDEMYHGDNSSSSSQPNYYTLNQPEIALDDEGFDLSYDTSNLIIQAPSTTQLLHRADPIFFQNNIFNQYDGGFHNNQQYSINIYNNMNNYFHLNEHNEANDFRGTRNMHNLNQSQWQNFFYYQPYQVESPFFINNNINRSMIPFLMNNIPSMPIDAIHPELYINPVDLCLNYYTPPRHQQTDNQEEHD